MSRYIIELADCALTPYAIETESGTEYGWGLMPKRKVDLDELLRVADECDAVDVDGVNEPLYYLSQSLAKMACCDAVFLCEGWENARGCRVERAAAVAYDLEIIGHDIPCTGGAR